MTETLSEAAGPTDSPLLEGTIGANLAATVAAHGSREALVDFPSGRRWTYDELLADVDAVALGLLELGVAKGDRVGMWAPNCPEWVLVQYATARIGAILVNINPAYRSHELSFVIGQSGMRTIVAVTEFKGSSYAEMIESVARREPGSRRRRADRRRTSWDALVAAGRGGDRTRLDEIGAGLSATTRSTSSTRRGPPDSPRARRSRTATSSTTAGSSAS